MTLAGADCASRARTLCVRDARARVATRRARAAADGKHVSSCSHDSRRAKTAAKLSRSSIVCAHVRRLVDEGMQANRMADGRTSKRRADDAESSDAGKRHKSAGERCADVGRSAGGALSTSATKMRASPLAQRSRRSWNRCEVLETRLHRRSRADTHGTRAPVAAGRHEGLGLSRSARWARRSDSRWGSPRAAARRQDASTSLSQSRWTTTAASPPPPADRRRSPARRWWAPVDVQPSGATARASSTRAHFRARREKID